MWRRGEREHAPGSSRGSFLIGPDTRRTPPRFAASHDESASSKHEPGDSLMVASIGVISSAGQGVSYYERDGYYARDDPAHREASAWLGKGAGALDLAGSVEPQTFEKVLEGYVPDGSGRRLGKRGKHGSIHHRPGRDVTLSAPKSVSLAALVGGDRRIVSAHDRAVKRTLAWVEKNVLETRVMDPDSKTMVRRRDQKMVAATFRHDTSRNLDPQLHTHAVIANMLQGGDGKWRTMANEKLYRSKMLIGALYRSELAKELKGLGYGLYKTHADGRFEIRGVSREVVEAFSTRRAEIQKAMHERGLGKSGDNPALAARAALMTRAHKRDVDHQGAARRLGPSGGAPRVRRPGPGGRSRAAVCGQGPSEGGPGRRFAGDASDRGWPSRVRHRAGGELGRLTPVGAGGGVCPHGSYWRRPWRSGRGRSPSGTPNG